MAAAPSLLGWWATLPLHWPGHRLLPVGLWLASDVTGHWSFSCLDDAWSFLPLPHLRYTEYRELLGCGRFFFYLVHCLSCENLHVVFHQSLKLSPDAATLLRACVCVFAIACYKMLSEEVWIRIEKISLLFGIDSLRCVLNPPPSSPLLHLSLRMGNTFYWDVALPELVVQLWLLLTTTLNINISMK